LRLQSTRGIHWSLTQDGAVRRREDLLADPTQENLLREIQEDLRRERLEKLWKRYGSVLIGAAVALVVAVAAYQAWKAWELGQREARSAAFIAAERLAEADPAAAATAFAAIADEGSDGFAMLADFRQAALLVEEGRLDDAAAEYDGLATLLDHPLYRDLARLRWVSTRLSADAAAVEDSRLGEALAALSGDTNPWRFSAREMRAGVALRKGDVAQARELLGKLQADVETPQGVRTRSAETLARLDSR
jgi:hypothetical protein